MMLISKNGSLLSLAFLLVAGCGSSSGGSTSSTPGAGGSDSAGTGGSVAATGGATGASAGGTTSNGGSSAGASGSTAGSGAAGGAGPGTGGGTSTGGASPGGASGSSTGGASGGAGGAAAANSITGSFMGMPFTTAATTLWIGKPDSSITEVVYVFSAAVDCATLGAPGWDAKIPNDTQVLEMKTFGTAPATYTVVKSATPKSGEASVNHTLSKTTGASVESPGTGGTVTISTINAGKNILGAFSINFMADSLTGTFDATYCPGGVEP